MHESTISVPDDWVSQELDYELKHLSSGTPSTFLNVFPALDDRYPSSRSDLAVAPSQQYQPSTPNHVRVGSDQPDYSLLSLGMSRERSASTVSGYSATPESSALNVRRPRSHPGQMKFKVAKADKRKVARPREEDSRRKQLGPIAPPIPLLTFEALAEWALKYRGCLVASSIDDQTLDRNLNDPSERQKWGPEQLSSFKEHVQGGKGGPTICSICFVADGIFLPKRTKKQGEACKCMPVSDEDREKYSKLPSSARWWRPDYPPT